MKNKKQIGINFVLIVSIFLTFTSCTQNDSNVAVSSKTEQVSSDYWSKMKTATKLSNDQVTELKKISKEYEGYRQTQQKQLSRKLNDNEIKKWRVNKYKTIEKRLGEEVKLKVLKYNNNLTNAKGKK